MRRLACAVLLMLGLGATAARAQAPAPDPGDDGDAVFAQLLLGIEPGSEFDLAAGDDLDPGEDPGDDPGQMSPGGAGMGPGRGMASGGAFGMLHGRGAMMRAGRGMGPGLGGGMGWMLARRGALLAELKLTQAQRDKLADLRDAQMRAGIRARADLGLARLDLAKLLRADAPDRTAVDAAIDRMAHLQAELRKAQVGALLSMRSVLTPEQRQGLREWRERPARR